MQSPTPKILAAVCPWAVAVVLGLGLPCAVRAERTVGDSEGVDEPGGAPIVVESVLGEGEDVRASVEAGLLARLEGSDLSTPDGQPLVIVIEESPDDPTALRVGFRHRGEEAHAWTCQCSGLELQEQLPAHTREALRRVRAKAEDAVVRPAPAVTAPPSARPDPLAERRFERGLWMFGTGMMLTALGGGAILAGGTVIIAKAAMGDTNMPKWTIGLAATGAAVAAAGVPVLVIGHRRTRFGPPLTLRLMPIGPGLALQGRF